MTAGTLTNSTVIAVRLIREGKHTVRQISDDTALEPKEIAEIARVNGFIVGTDGYPRPISQVESSALSLSVQPLSTVQSGNRRSLVAIGKSSSRASTRRLAVRVEQLLEQLRETIEADAEHEAKVAREKAAKKAAADRVTALKAQLAEAQKVLRGDRKPKPPRGGPPSRSKEIRAWAAANGIDVPAVGAVRADVVAQYEAAAAK